MSKQFPTFYVGPVARDAALLVLLDCWLEVPYDIDVLGLALLKSYITTNCVSIDAKYR